MANTVALVRATKKGEQTKIKTSTGKTVEGKSEGTDGRKFHRVIKRDVNDWMCTCPSSKFKVNGTRMCKHQLAVFQKAKGAKQEEMDIRIKKPELL